MTREVNYKKKIKRRKVKWICHVLHRSYVLKHVIDEKIEGRSKRKTRNKTLAATGSTKLHSVESSFWKWLWTCLKADYKMNV